MDDPFKVLEPDVIFGSQGESQETPSSPLVQEIPSSPLVQEIKVSQPVTPTQNLHLKTSRGVDMPPPLAIPPSLKAMKEELKSSGWNPLDLNKSELTELYKNPDCGDNYECDSDNFCDLRYNKCRSSTNKKHENELEVAWNLAKSAPQDARKLLHVPSIGYTRDNHKIGGFKKDILTFYTHKETIARDLSDMMQINKDASSVRDSLQLQLQHQKELDEKAETLASEHKQLSSDLDLCSKSSDDLKTANKELTSRLDSLNSEHSDLIKQNEDNLGKISKNNEKIEKYNTEKEELTIKISDLLSQIQELEGSSRELVTLEEAHRLIIQERDSIKSQYDKLQDDMERLSTVESDKNSLEDEITRLGKDLGRLQLESRELEKLRNDYSSLDSDKKSLDKQYQQIESDLSKLSNEIQEKNDKISELKEINTQLSQHIDQLKTIKTDKDQCSSSLANIKSLNEELQLKSQKLSNRLESINLELKQLEEMKGASLEKCEVSKKELKSKTINKNNVLKRIDESTNWFVENIRKINDCEQLNKLINETKRKSEKSQGKMKSDEKSLIDMTSRLENDLDIPDKEKLMLQRQINDLETNLENHTINYNIYDSYHRKFQIQKEFCEKMISKSSD